MTKSVHDLLQPDLIKTLVTNGERQKLLEKDKAYRSLIAGLLRMKNSGRSRARMDPSNRQAGFAVLSSVSDNVDCLFLHLREIPTLCVRHLWRSHRSTENIS
jgi:hypothetical protein